MDRILLEGRTALITGAAKRIGRATALALADEGVNVVVHYRSSDAEAEDLVRELDGLGVSAWAVGADFEKPEDYETLIERAITAAGAIDFLVNNASMFRTERLEDLTFSSLMTNVEVNAWAPFVLCRDFARLVSRGKIVNILDSRISGYDWTHVGYIMSKQVLAVFTRMTALKFAPDITVNAVSPGLILPPPGEDHEYLDRLKGTLPLKRHGEAEDVADAIVYLLKSNMLTGEIIYVDGGRHLKEYTDG